MPHPVVVALYCNTRLCPSYHFQYIYPTRSHPTDETIPWESIRMSNLRARIITRTLLFGVDVRALITGSFELLCLALFYLHHQIELEYQLKLCLECLVIGDVCSCCDPLSFYKPSVRARLNHQQIQDHQLVVVTQKIIRRDEITNIKPVGIECTAPVNQFRGCSVSPTGSKA